jgi:hypothetical protein
LAFFSNSLTQVKPRAIWEHDIKEHDVGLDLAIQFHAFFGRRRREHGISLLSELMFNGFKDCWFVVYEKYLHD